MARKSNQRKQSGQKRSLTARKTHFKSVSNYAANMENNDFHRGAGSLMAEPPKAGFETHIPRKVREMQAAMQRVKDMEAGKKVAWRAHREDVPRPKTERPQKRKRNAEDPATDKNEDAAAQTSGNAEAAVFSQQDRKRAEAVAEPTAAIAAAAKKLAGAIKKKPHDHVVEKRPRFGDTNAAPPTLQIGGQLKKKIAEQRVAQGKEARLSLQREQAIAAYAAAKAAKREEAKKARGSDAPRAEP